MIRLENLTKGYGYQGQVKYIVKDASITIPDGATVGLMGRNGAGKSTLLQLIAGTLNPNSGRVRIDGNVSWPIGLAGCIHPEMTGTQNVRFIARVYGVDTDELVDFVGDFCPAWHPLLPTGSHLFVRDAGAAELRHVDGHPL